MAIELRRCNCNSLLSISSRLENGKLILSISANLSEFSSWMWSQVFLQIWSELPGCFLQYYKWIFSSVSRCFSWGASILRWSAELNSIIASSWAVLYSHEILVPGHRSPERKLYDIPPHCVAIFLLPQFHCHWMIAYILFLWYRNVIATNTLER